MRNSCLKYVVDIGVAIEEDESEFLKRVQSLFRIINGQIMEVEANNFTACNLARKLACLEDIEGGKFVVVYAPAKSATDIKRFLHSLKKNTTFSSSRWWLVL